MQKKRIKYTITISALICVSLIAPVSVAQQEKRELGAINFSCLQFDSGYAGEASSHIALVERSSRKIPMPELRESCTSYLVRLIGSGSTTDKLASVSVPATINCKDLIDSDDLLPPSSQPKYLLCLSYAVYGLW